MPELPETFWGPENNKGVSQNIRPFIINVSKSVSYARKILLIHLSKLQFKVSLYLYLLHKMCMCMCACNYFLILDFLNKVIDDLKARLERKRELVPPLQNAAWTYGMSTTYLETVLEYWRTKYNWFERQALLNKYPQYMTNVQGNLLHLLSAAV